MGDDRRIGEAILVVIAIVALLVSAAFLPTVDIFGSNEAIAEQLPDGSQLPAGTQSPGGPAAGTQAGDQSGDMESTGDGESGESQSARSGEPAGIGAPGQTAGGSLTNPPQSAQISGSLGEQPSQVPLFTVESPVNTYWRQTAYETYTGTGWQQAGATTPLDEGIPNDDRTGGNRRITYDVTLLEGGRSLPTAWQPESVSFPGDDSQPALQTSRPAGFKPTSCCRRRRPTPQRVCSHRGSRRCFETPVAKHHGRSARRTPGCRATHLTASASSPVNFWRGQTPDTTAR